MEASRSPGSLRIATSLFERARGLLCAPASPGELLIAPCRDIHTVGMRHAIDVAFLDAGGVVIESYRSVGPMRRLRCRGAKAVVERFSECGPWLEKGDGVFLERRHARRISGYSGKRG